MSDAASASPALAELDLSLFVLPVRDEQAFGVALPEPPELVRGARGRRPDLKRGFWFRLVRAITFRPDFTIEPRAYCPLSDERIEELTEWAGLFADPEYCEQPVDTLNAMDERMAQFSLRNLVRYEKDAWPDELRFDWKTLRKLPHEMGLDEIRSLAIHPKLSLLQDWNLDALAEANEAYRHLFRELDWATLRFRGGRLYETPEQEREREQREAAGTEEADDESDIL